MYIYLSDFYGTVNRIICRGVDWLRILKTHSAPRYMAITAVPKFTDGDVYILIWFLWGSFNNRIICWRVDWMTVRFWRPIQHHDRRLPLSQKFTGGVLYHIYLSDFCGTCIWRWRGRRYCPKIYRRSLIYIYLSEFCGTPHTKRTALLSQNLQTELYIYLSYFCGTAHVEEDGFWRP